MESLSMYEFDFRLSAHLYTDDRRFQRAAAIGVSGRHSSTGVTTIKTLYSVPSVSSSQGAYDDIEDDDDDDDADDDDDDDEGDDDDDFMVVVAAAAAALNNFFLILISIIIMLCHHEKGVKVQER